jgi:RHS repeat-associated protein
VRQLTDGSGDVELAQGYTPFGVLLWREGSGASGYGYTGEREDGYIKLVFLRARYYDSYLGRFISPDTIIPDFTNPQSLNRHSYVLGNPVRYTDPEGLVPRPPSLHGCIVNEDAYNLTDWLAREMHHQSNHWPVAWGISLLNFVGRYYDLPDGPLYDSVIVSLLDNLLTYIPWNWHEHSYRDDISILAYTGASLWWAGMVGDGLR